MWSVVLVVSLALQPSAKPRLRLEMATTDLRRAGVLIGTSSTFEDRNSTAGTKKNQCYCWYLGLQFCLALALRRANADTRVPKLTYPYKLTLKIVIYASSNRH